MRGYRALPTPRCPRHADGGAEVHQGLVPVVNVLRHRKDITSDCPPMAVCIHSKWDRNLKNSVKNTSYIRVQNRFRKPECEAGDCPGGVRANPLEGTEAIYGGWKGGIATPDHRPRRLVEADGPPVIPKTGPGADHVGTGSRREVCKGGEQRKEGMPLRPYPVDLRLLQHGFGHEDRVWITRVAPREVTALAPVPRKKHTMHIGHDLGSETAHTLGRLDGKLPGTPPISGSTTGRPVHRPI